MQPNHSFCPAFTNSCGTAVKQTICFRPAFFLILGATALAAPEYGWINALKPPGEPGPEMVLTQKERHPDHSKDAPAGAALVPWVVAKVDIVVPAQPTAQEQKAAFELSRWLEEMTGAPIAVKTDASRKHRAEINVGRTNRFLAADLAFKQIDLKEEGYAIVSKDGDLFLWGGRKRGPLYAVFALLEEDMGCRWYPRHVTLVPKNSNLTIRPVSRWFVPKLEGREPFSWSSLDPVWSLRNRTNSAQVQLPEEWGGYMCWPIRTHSFTLLVPPAKHFKDHPEYYGLQNGKRVPNRLCLTNPDLVPLIAANLAEVLRASPGARAIMISKEDGGWSECACERCVAFNQAHGYEKNILGKPVPGGGAATHLALVNAVAERLEKDFPDVLFCTYAYTYTMIPPTGIVARPNVGIRLCNSLLHVRPFTSVADSAEYQEIHRGWQAVTSNLFIYDYWSNYHAHSVPIPNMPMVVKNIRWFVDHNVREISGLTTATWTSEGDRDAMRTWVAAKLLWDARLDLKQLQRDFNFGYYGKAGSVMLDYDALIQASYEKHKDDPSVQRPAGGRNFDMNIAFFSPDFIEKASALLLQAQELVEDTNIRADIEIARQAVLQIPKTAERQRATRPKKDALQQGL